MDNKINKLIYDIEQAILNIENFIHGHTDTEFKENMMMKLAVERLFEIIGEAINRIKKNDKAIYDMIDESDKIICFRNIITHGYDVIDDDITWSVSNEKIPVLKENIRKIKEHLNE